ncbi:MAG: serine/threonine-protein kinase [Mariprofundaceae bacterium]|nr:serine/threonine-protein kinase [Mariprofundaceae bacterium]
MKSAFWKKDWFLGLAVTLFFLAMGSSSMIRSLEFATYDAGVAASAVPADDRIVILDIDDESIELIGRWPWPRTIMADMIDTLNEAGARIIGVDVFFSEKQAYNTDNAALKLASLLQEQGDELLAEAEVYADEGNQEAADQTFDEADAKFAEAEAIIAEAEANNGDARLVNASFQAGNVFMPMFYEAGEPFGRPDEDLPDYVRRMGIENIGDVVENSPPISAIKLSYPFAELSQVAAGLGYLNVSPSVDGVLRSEPLIVEYYGQFFPSLSLAMVAHDLNLTMDDVRINIGSSVELGALTIETDSAMQVSPSFYAGDSDGEHHAFQHFPFYDVRNGKIPLELLKDKIVLIGVTGTGIGSTYVTPIATDLNGVEYHAHVIQSLLHDGFIQTPEWAGMAELALLLFAGFYLIVLLPRLSAMVGTVASLSLFLIIAGMDFVLLTESGLWVQTMTAAGLLLVGHVLLTTKRFFASEDDREKITSESAETNKMLALSFQSQGMLDMSFDKFRKCPPTDDILSGLYTLALDFERKRQFNKATAVYEYILEANASFKDVQQRMDRTKDAGESMIFGAAGVGTMGTLMITGGAKPTLGRYEIIKELGKGAMGTVYLGKDPKINRDVAIKTMALSQEFEGDELQDVKERFFREAETAGMLNHPNIVTMYDAGEEHDLAFIAMEFLDGTDLSPYTKKGKLLPQMATMKIVGKVAEALHYASSQRVVHRDIKPANIMLLKDKSVKVTDFGIARITASSKTKTGVVLGTPSYMSPEQLAGKHVDGRSDIFSLGVMLYEMLTGVRPFKGDSMATLLFQIANEPHPDIREFDPNLPENVSKLINMMLVKDADKRIPNGGAVIRGIITCLKTMAVKGK